MKSKSVQPKVSIRVDWATELRLCGGQSATDLSSGISRMFTATAYDWLILEPNSVAPRTCANMRKKKVQTAVNFLLLCCSQVHFRVRARSGPLLYQNITFACCSQEPRHGELITFILSSLWKIFAILPLEVVKLYIWFAHVQSTSCERMPVEVLVSWDNNMTTMLDVTLFYIYTFIYLMVSLFLPFS